MEKKNIDPPNYIASLEDSKLAKIMNGYDPEQVIVLVDEHTFPFIEKLQSLVSYALNAIQLPSGEEHKTINTVAGIWKDLSDHHFRRDGLIINLGGGVITDMGGFAASTFKRGVDFINIPTTLLAMVDAAIGGKTGVDFDHFKNQVGVINNPVAIFSDVDFLVTLPKEELIAGFAEVLKHGLIDDVDYWQYCSTTSFENLDWEKVIAKSIAIKSIIVAKDPDEKGERKLLNFGHTVGHAIESLYLENVMPILHGNAIAIGMICESFISFKNNLLNEKELQVISDRLIRIFPKVDIQTHQFRDIITRMKNDKKNNSSEINFTLLERIGNGIPNQSSNMSYILASLEYYTGL